MGLTLGLFDTILRKKNCSSIIKERLLAQISYDKHEYLNSHACVGGGRAHQSDPTNYCMRGQLESRFLRPEDERLDFLIDKMRNRSQGKMAISSINDIAAMTIDHIFHLEQVCVRSYPSSKIWK